MAFCPLWIALTKVVSVVVRTLISIVGLSLWEPVQDLRGSAAARVVLEPPAGALALHHLFARRGGGPFRDDASDGGEVLDERCELGVDERELLVGELQLPDFARRRAVRSEQDLLDGRVVRVESGDGGLGAEGGQRRGGDFVVPVVVVGAEVGRADVFPLALVL